MVLNTESLDWESSALTTRPLLHSRSPLLAILIKKSELKQKLFHECYCSEGHQGIENWSVTLIDQVEDLDSLRKKELYWINRLNTWAPNGLNVREVYEAYN